MDYQRDNLSSTVQRQIQQIDMAKLVVIAGPETGKGARV